MVEDFHNIIPSQWIFFSTKKMIQHFYELTKIHIYKRAFFKNINDPALFMNFAKIHIYKRANKKNKLLRPWPQAASWLLYLSFRQLLTAAFISWLSFKEATVANIKAA